MKRTRKYLSVLLAFVLAFAAATVSVSAASVSLDSVPRYFAGWGVSIKEENNVQLKGSKIVGGLDNRNSTVKTNYTFSEKFTHSIDLGGELSNDLSASINVAKGIVSGGLGAEINSKFSIANGYIHEYSQKISVEVPARKNLTLYSDPYGKKISGYAKWFVAWITIKSGNLTVSIPNAQKYRVVCP